VGLSHPVATVTPITVPITYTMAPATNTHTVHRATALGVDFHSLTATTIIHASKHAISTKLTSTVLARVRMGLSHPASTITVTRITVPITYWTALASDTKSTSVVRAVALMVKNYVLTATIHALITPTSIRAISSKLTSVQVRALGLDQALTATTLHALITQLTESATSTKQMSVELAVG